jgi:hypothetical protein
MDFTCIFAPPRCVRHAALLAAFLAFTPLPAAAGETVAMRFDVAIAGTRAFELDYRLELGAEGYASAVSLESRGVIALFSAIELDMEGAGRFEGQGLMPATFQMGSTRKGKDKLANVAWTPGQAPAARRSYALPPEREAAIRQALAADMPDPLTALLKAAVLAAGTPCTGTERVFNGAEVYDLRFELVKPDSFEASDGGVYRGPAFKCSLTYVPVAGLDKKKAEKRLKEPPRFDMWFAPVLTRTRGTVYVPVAAAGSVRGATFIALSSRASLDGAPLNAQSLASQ